MDGGFSVSFAGPTGMGHGVAYIGNGKVQGGDSGYSYIGELVDENGTLKGRIEIRRHTAGMVSVFGNQQSFVLDLEGRPTPGGFQVSGKPQGLPGAISITGKRLA